MKFSDIRYTKRDTPFGEQIGIVMPGRFWVYRSTMRAAWVQLNNNWPSINWSHKQCAETMIGTDYWQKIRLNGARLAMGRCVRFFVEHDMLPIRLEIANPRKKGKRFYRPHCSSLVVKSGLSGVGSPLAVRERPLPSTLPGAEEGAPLKFPDFPAREFNPPCRPRTPTDFFDKGAM